jgi:cysteine synthase A
MQGKDTKEICKRGQDLSNGRNGILQSVGNTPLIELKTLSKLTGCRIMAKCEHLNPTGSVKDRAALWIVEDAERNGSL